MTIKNVSVDFFLVKVFDSYFFRENKTGKVIEN